MSLRYRIAAVVFILELAMIALLIWQMQGQYSAHIEKHFNRSENTVMRLLGDLALIALVTREYQDFNRRSENLLDNDFIQAVMLSDEHQRVVASTEPAQLGRDESALDRQHWHTLPVTGGSGVLGALAVRFSHAHLLQANRAARSSAIELAVVGMAVIAAAGIVSGFLLTRRLDRLTQAAGAVALGNFSTAFDTRGRDEVARLASALDHMLASVRELLRDRQRRERNSQQLLDTLPAGIVAANAHGECVMANATANRLLGLSRPDMLLGQRLDAFLGPRDAAAPPAATSDGAPAIQHLARTTLTRADGADLPAEVWCYEMPDQAGAILQITAFRDITDYLRVERQREEAVRELAGSETRFRDFADLAADWLWEQDEELRYSYVSESFETILGVSTAGLIGKTRAQYHRAHAKLDDPAWVAHLQQISARQSFRNFEFEFEAPDGCHRISISGRPVFDEAGRFRGYRGVGRDLTLLRVALERLEHTLDENRLLARAMVRAQEEERRRLARDLHDDVGQALAAIQAEVEAVRLAPLPPDQSTAHSIDAISRLADAVYDAMHSTMEQLHPALMDDLGLVEALHELCASWSQRHRATALHYAFPERLELGPETRIGVYRIVQESLTNISKHSRAGEVRICVRHDDDGEGQVTIDIRDDGVGVAAIETARGLGLISMRERASVLGGEVELSSSPGGGFRVFATLPAGGAD